MNTPENQEYTEERYERILGRFDEIEQNAVRLMNKYLLHRNDNKALRQRIDTLESENGTLKETKNVTVSRLRMLLEKFDEAGF